MKIKWSKEGWGWYGKGAGVREYIIEGKWANATTSEGWSPNIGWGPTVEHLKARCQTLENYYANGGKVWR